MGSVQAWRWLLAAVVGVEAAALAVGAVAVVVEIFRDVESLSRALFLAFMLLAFAGGMGAVAAGLAQGRRWSRAPAVTWQIIQGAVAVTAIGTQLTAFGVVAIALAVLVVAGALQPRLFEDIGPRG